MTRRPLLVALAVALAGCAVHGTEPGTPTASSAVEKPVQPQVTGSASGDTTAVTPSLVYPMPTSPPAPTTEAPQAGPPVPAPVDVRAELAQLAIDDRPDGSGYRRDLLARLAQIIERHQAGGATEGGRSRPGR